MFCCKIYEVLCGAAPSAGHSERLPRGRPRPSQGPTPQFNQWNPPPCAIRFQRTQNLTLACSRPCQFFFLSLCGVRAAFSSSSSSSRGSCDADKGRAAREGKSLAGEWVRWMDVCTRKSCAVYFICHSAVRLGLRDIASSLSAAFPAKAHFPEDERGNLIKNIYEFLLQLFGRWKSLQGWQTAPQIRHIYALKCHK